MLDYRRSFGLSSSLVRITYYPKRNKSVNSNLIKSSRKDAKIAKKTKRCAVASGCVGT